MSDRHNLRPLHLGLIGAGPWGRNYISTIAELDGVNLTRLASTNPDSARLVGPECVISKNWQDVVDAEELDGLVIASPPSTHADIALAAISKGLAVLLEKPMALSVVDAGKILAAAQAEDAIVMVDHIHLYSAAWEALRREASALGAIRTMMGIAGKWCPIPPRTPILWEWGSHDLAMCISLIGRVPENVSVKRIDFREGGETLSLALDFGDAVARLTISSLFQKPNRFFSIFFDGGELIYDDTLGGGDKLRLKTSSEDPGGTFKLNAGTPLERCVRNFRDTVLRGGPDWDDVILGFQVTETLDRLEARL